MAMRFQLATRAAPTWYWERASLATDGHAGPGLVTAGRSRSEFADAAIDWLSRRFAMGVVVEAESERRATPYVPWRFDGVSTMEVSAATRARLLSEHRNLGRKIRRFTVRGGTVERIAGAMPPSLGDALERGYRIPRPPDPPFRELYPVMVRQHWSMTTSALVHLVARINGNPVGYHSFIQSGRRLLLLSGVFDRIDGGTAHAYENILLASIDVAVDRGCDTVEYGPATNPVKRSLLMTRPAELRFVSRIAPVRGGLRAFLPRSVLAGASAATVAQE